LGADERARAAAFRFERHRDRFVRRRVLLRRLLSEATGDDAAGLRYSVNDHGRPYLADHPTLFFSASSTGDLGVVAISGCDLGVDVELEEPHDADRAVARRLFAPEEIEVLDEAPDDELTRLFFSCWTRKEAYVKATGLGLSFPLDSFAVELDETPRPRLLRSTLRPGDLRTHSLRSLEAPEPRVCAALVVAHPDPRVSSSD
jgi:4'-phosphopantetheinyl transferase